MRWHVDKYLHKPPVDRYVNCTPPDVIIYGLAVCGVISIHNNNNNANNNINNNNTLVQLPVMKAVFKSHSNKDCIAYVEPESATGLDIT